MRKGGERTREIGDILWYDSVVVEVDFVPSLVLVAAGRVGCGEIVVWADGAVAADSDICLVIEGVVVAVCDGDICTVDVSMTVRLNP